MAKPLRIGIAGIRHSHIRTLLGHWREDPDVEIVAAADGFASARALASDEWQIPDVYETLDELFDRHELDGVTATLPNTRHAEITELCAERGVALLLEKPMAASLADADRMVLAAETAGIPAVINWPNLADTAFERAAELLAEGAIGAPRQFIYRGGNDIATRRDDVPDWFQWLFDAADGGGSWTDYAGYGAAPCLMLMGRPRRVVARGTTLADPRVPADDAAVVILEFERGLGIMQTSHVQVGSDGPGGHLMHIEVGGERGTLLITRGPGAAELRIFDGGDRRDGELLPVPDAPPEWRNGVAGFAHVLRSGEQPVERASLRFNREVTALIDAGMRALTSGAAITLPPALAG